jgi:hypothetical protein
MWTLWTSTGSRGRTTSELKKRSLKGNLGRPCRCSRTLAAHTSTLRATREPRPARGRTRAARSPYRARSPRIDVAEELNEGQATALRSAVIEQASYRLQLGEPERVVDSLRSGLRGEGTLLAPAYGVINHPPVLTAAHPRERHRRVAAVRQFVRPGPQAESHVRAPSPAREGHTACPIEQAGRYRQRSR